MTEIKVVTVGEKLHVRSPYNPEFPRKAKTLGGRWNAGHKTWVFSVRDETRVRDLVRETYGTDGESDVPTVTIRRRLVGNRDEGSELWVAGRKALWRTGRDMPVRMGEDVVLVEGKLTRTGGSRQYPVIGSKGAVIELRNVPASLVELQENVCWIIDGDAESVGPLAAYSDEDILAEARRRGLI